VNAVKLRRISLLQLLIIEAVVAVLIYWGLSFIHLEMAR
jgi:ethanolamine transporter EutH